MTDPLNPPNIPVKVKKTGTISRFDKYIDSSNNIDIENISLSNLYETLQKINFEKLVDDLRASQYNLDKHIADNHNPHRVDLSQLTQNPMHWIYSNIIPGKASYRLSPSFTLRPDIIREMIISNLNKLTQDISYTLPNNVYLFTILKKYSQVKSGLPVDTLMDGVFFCNDSNGYNLQSVNIDPIYNSVKTVYHMYDICIVDDTHEQISIYTAPDGNPGGVNMSGFNMRTGTMSFLIRNPVISKPSYLYMDFGNNRICVVLLNAQDRNICNSIKHWNQNGNDIKIVAYAQPIVNGWYKVNVLFNNLDQDFTNVKVILTGAEYDRIMEVIKNPSEDMIKNNLSPASQTIMFDGALICDRDITRFPYINTSLPAAASSFNYDLKAYKQTDNIYDLNRYKTLTLRSVNFPSIANPVKQHYNLGDIEIYIHSAFNPNVNSVSIKTIYEIKINNLKDANTTQIYEVYDSQLETSLTLTRRSDKRIYLHQNGELQDHVLTGHYDDEYFNLPDKLSLTENIHLHSLETYECETDKDEMTFLNCYFSNAM